MIDVDDVVAKLFLMWPERDARIHPGQLQMAAVIAALAQAVVPVPPENLIPH